MNSFVKVFLCAALALSPVYQADAAYPEKEIKLVVPYAPGGASDAIFRVMADNLSKTLNKPVVVVNMGGASASKGTRFVKDSKPDGYTIGGINETLYTAHYAGITEYDYTALTPICLLTKTPNFLVTYADAPFNNLKELFEYAKANPGTLRITYTPSSIAQVFFQGLLKNAGVSEDLFRSIGINDTGNQIKNLLGKHVDLVMGGITSAMEYVKDGRLKFLGVANETRLDSAPDVPTFEEQGVKWYNGTNRGLAGPLNFPQEALDTIAAAFKKICSDPEFIAKMKTMGCAVQYLSPADYKEYIIKADAIYKEFMAPSK